MLMLRRICLLLHITLVQPKYRLHVRGIYSTCELEQEKRNDFTKQGTIFQYFASRDPFIEYQGIDVCYNQTSLVEIAVNMLLNPLFYIEHKGVDTLARYFNIDSIILHLPTDMFVVFQSILSVTDTMFVKFSRDIELPNRFADALAFDTTLTTISIEKVIAEHWREVLFLEIKHSNQKPSFIVEDLVHNLVTKEDTCLKMLSIDDANKTDVNRLEKLLEQEYNEQIAILVFNSKDRLYQLPSPIMKFNKSFIFAAVLHFLI